MVAGRVQRDEIYVSLDEMGGRRKYEVYTAHKHEHYDEERLAVGFTDGVTSKIQEDLS